MIDQEGLAEAYQRDEGVRAIVNVLEDERPGSRVTSEKMESETGLDNGEVAHTVRVLLRLGLNYIKVLSRDGFEIEIILNQQEMGVSASCAGHTRR